MRYLLLATSLVMVGCSSPEPVASAPAPVKRPNPASPSVSRTVTNPEAHPSFAPPPRQAPTYEPASIVGKWVSRAQAGMTVQFFPDGTATARAESTGIWVDFKGTYSMQGSKGQASLSTENYGGEKAAQPDPNGPRIVKPVEIVLQIEMRSDGQSFAADGKDEFVRS